MDCEMSIFTAVSKSSVVFLCKKVALKRAGCSCVLEDYQTYGLLGRRVLGNSLRALADSVLSSWPTHQEAADERPSGSRGL